MIDLTLFSIFSFLSLLMFAIGVYSKSNLLCMAGGGIFALTGMLEGINGLRIQDGTFNSTSTIVTANITIVTQAPNFTTLNPTVSGGVFVVYLVLGLVMVYYGWIIPPSEIGDAGIMGGDRGEGETSE